MTARMYYDADADPAGAVRRAASPSSATARRATPTRSTCATRATTCASACPRRSRSRAAAEAEGLRVLTPARRARKPT